VSADVFVMTWAEQIPTVSRYVEKDSDATIGFVAWGSNELDAGIGHPLEGGVEVLDLEEEADASGDLSAHNGRLILSVGSSQQDSCLGAGRTNDDPPLRVPSVRQRGGVLDQLEAKGINKERDSEVVVLDDDRRQLQKRHPGSMSHSPW
jgi:hypothetical protein